VDGTGGKSTAFPRNKKIYEEEDSEESQEPRLIEPGLIEPRTRMRRCSPPTLPKQVRDRLSRGS